ncbi:MAG: DUF2063 domain-containing protein [Micavibrio sp.]|nr:MAG: DUF2063 domain-containing protein [Micavibrio sp.]
MLHNEQKQFLHALLHADADVPASVAADGKFSPAQRFQVYRNNVRLILTGSLKKTFPVTEALVGADFFRTAAREFIKNAQPQDGDMSFYGDLFPDFLSDFPPLANHRYISDIAALEWAFYSAGILPEKTPVATPLPENTRVRLQPHASVLSSPYAVFDIWSSIRDGETEALSRIKTDTPCRILIYRADDGVTVLSVKEDLHAFAEILFHGAHLNEAVAQALAVDTEFPAEDQTGYFLRNKILCADE